MLTGMAEVSTDPPLSGRRAEAARNDDRILEAARAVFVADPEAPIAAVAKRAGVGISALYRRYPSKEDLLRTLCADGLQRYIATVEQALADDGDPWEAFAKFMRSAVDNDSTSLTLHLAGTFTPTADLYAAANRAQELNLRLFERAREAGVLRPDLDANDMGLVLEQIAALHLGDAERTRAIRQRHLALVLDGLRAPGHTELPAPPPTWDEIAGRWSA
jgi:AcrR family transcriptional regulator